MADDRMIELQRGREYYWEASKEFARRGLDVEMQVAFGFETGYQIGRAEAISEESLKLLRQPALYGNNVSAGPMMEWA